MFSLPSLKYGYNELEPHVDEATMFEHHDFHHKAYVSNLNMLVEKVGYKGEGLVHLLTKTIRDTSVEDAVRTGIWNHGGGHYNHSLFWVLMKKDSKIEEMVESLRAMVARDFGSVEKFKGEFSARAVKVFGSGWAWLVYDKMCKKLEIMTTLNQDTPFGTDENKLPVLGLDVWEHAYYLQYKHARNEYVEKWWNVVDWANVSRLFEKYSLNDAIIRVGDDGTIN